MAIINRFNSYFSDRVQRTLALVAGIFGLDLNLKTGRVAKIVIECRDGQTITCQTFSDDACTNTRNGSPVTPSVPVTWTSGTLSSGVKANYSVTNAVGDRLVCREVTPGGTPADYFEATRVDNSNVQVTAYKRTPQGVSAAIETGNTSVVEVANLKQLGTGNETPEYRCCLRDDLCGAGCPSSERSGVHEEAHHLQPLS